MTPPVGSARAEKAASSRSSVRVTSYEAGRRNRKSAHRLALRSPPPLVKQPLGSSAGPSGDHTTPSSGTIWVRVSFRIGVSFLS